MDDHTLDQVASRATRRPRRIPSAASPHSPNWPAAIAAALQQSNGARYYRCALQVNTPFQTRFKGFDSKYPRHSEQYQRDFASALARKCKKIGIDVIGLCDHNSIDYLEVVRQELTQEGIFVFPGFEVASTEGLHILCLFDLDTPAQELDHVLTELGLPPNNRWVTGRGLAPRQSPKSFPQIVEQIQRQRRGICIAAHIDRENGLLFECAKTTRVQYFTDRNLLAGQIAGAKSELMSFHRKILAGELDHYRREHALACLNCLDVYNLKDLGKPACSTLIKMSHPGIEGLWQAFLDPDSRLGLLTEEGESGARHRPANVRLVAMAWEGGFLDGCGIHFNENMNCLIGGRGTGKSSVIESLRYVLDRRPIGNLATLNHESILREVIQSGTKISLLVRVDQPSPRHYLIQRTYPGDPRIYDENGRLSRLKVFDLAPDLEIFGQHEIAEIANDRGKQLRLLHRYRNEPAARLEAGKVELAHQLEANRNELLRTRRDLQATEEQLARLPSLEEKLRSYQERGLEEKLREQSLLAREEQLIRFGRERVANLAKLIEQVRQRLEAEWQYAGVEETEKLPNVDLLKKIRQTQDALSRALSASLDRADRALEQARKDLLEVAQEWERRRQMRQQDYEQALRDLQKEGIDGTAFVKLRQELEGLEPVRVQHARLVQRFNRLSKKRERLLQSWQDTRDQLFNLDAGAAGRINRLLAGRVRLAMEQEAGREVLIEKLKSFKLGFRGEVYERLCSHPAFNPSDFARHLREGKDSLRQHYGLTERQAQTLANLEGAVALELEEIALPNAMRIELNVAQPGEPARWKSMPELSIGQKATAILMMLFPESGAPLVIDQPEDDLDNRFIAESIIPTLRQEKRGRQFIFATHNANLPVLGDAELIIALEASGEGRTGGAKIHAGNVGSIDRESVKLLVEQVLEGGRQAFEMRRAKYGF